MKKKAFFLLALIFASSFLFAAFEGVEPPVVTNVSKNANDPLRVDVEFTLDIDGKAVNKAQVDLISSSGKVIESKSVGRSRSEVKKTYFNPPVSDSYKIVVHAIKNGEPTTLDSSEYAFDYSYPLSAPELTLKNLGDYQIEVSWDSVNEAKEYTVAYDGKEVTLNDTSLILTDLEPNKTYSITVSAVRGEGDESSATGNKTARETADRDWTFTWFGQSTTGSRNKMEMIDSDNLTFRLLSCTTTPDGNDIQDKGGKFTTFHDGVSYYYTVIDPDTENFELTATFTVDFINPIADGQEGFGLLAMDSLGEDGVSSVNHYTNSAGVIATKFEETIGGTKYTSKDTLGARFVSEITPEVLSGGDSMIAEKGKNVSHGYSYNVSDLTRKGNSYRITLKMDNTGFHAIYKRANLDETTKEEYILYGKDKLRQLDKEHIYVGFAVARGCNVTVSDVEFKITDPLTDPPAEEEPPELLAYSVKVDSPSSWYNRSYQFVFASNADGSVTITNADGSKTYVKDAPVTANVDYTKRFGINQGVNDIVVTFTPKEGYEPFERTRMAKYDDLKKEYVENYEPIVIRKSINYIVKSGDTLYVSGDGSIFGDGSYNNPLDIDSAILYSAPGQTIVLKDGVYNISNNVTIERGNSGKQGSPKRIIAENRGKAILDFSFAKAGMVIWGDWWEVDGIVIRNTKGDQKGLQVAGDYNIIRFVEAYNCGDTGIQISGTGAETFEKWPHDNLIYACVSHDNRDPAENNADGFAAKITVGDNNVFDSCVSYHNIDDGWDLFAKIESGPIGAVTIQNSIAYGNGSLSDGSGNGDGNGFKLGGDGIAVSHKLINSVTFQNGAAGVTSNSDPAVQLYNVTSYGNKGANIALYGKGDGSRMFVAEGVVSVNGGSEDNISEMPELKAPDNYFFNGGESVNSLGEVFSPSNFKSTEFAGFSFDEDGKLILDSGYLEIVKGQAGVGATL